MKLIVTIVSMVIGALVFAGCGESTETSARKPQSTTTTSSSSSKPSVSTASSATVKVSSSRYGKILVDKRGHTLYRFTRDKGKNKSKCYGDCATAWPPFYAKEALKAGSGVKQSLLGKTKRSDSNISQATYRGHPLYYYQGETKPEQILCQAVEEFGGIWFVVAPSGKAIRSQ